LFAPPSLIAEGTANLRHRVAFPATNRSVFERQLLNPEAGLESVSGSGRRSSRVQRWSNSLAYA